MSDVRIQSLSHSVCGVLTMLLERTFRQWWFLSARTMSEPKLEGKISFVIAPGEKAPQEISPQSVDMVTGAECYPLMDHDKFFKECARILKPGSHFGLLVLLKPCFRWQPGSKTGSTPISHMGPLLRSTTTRTAKICWTLFYWTTRAREYRSTAMAEVSPPQWAFCYAHW